MAAANEGVVLVKTVDGELHRQWNVDWKVNNGVLTVVDADDRYTVYAAGQWVFARDVDPE